MEARQYFLWKVKFKTGWVSSNSSCLIITKGSRKFSVLAKEIEKLMVDVQQSYTDTIEFESVEFVDEARG